MTLVRLAWCGLRHHWRRHVASGLGILVSGTMLMGALVVGQTVREHLWRTALARLGRVEIAIETGAVRPELGPELARSLGVDGAAVLRLAGTVSSGDGRLRVGRVQVLGVDDAFWRLDATRGGERGAGVLVNRRLAALLGLRRGDEIVVRTEDERDLPLELPFAWSRRPARALRLAVSAIVEDEHLGRFDLASHQVSPATLFVERQLLARTWGSRDRANLILLAGGQRGLSRDTVLEALRQRLRLEDVDLALRRGPSGQRQLVSSRFFLPPAAVGAAQQVEPAAQAMLAYLVNEIRGARGVVPYSFVAAPGPPWTPRGMADDEIVLGEWLAQALRARATDLVELAYFAPDAGVRLVEQRARFRVRSVARGAWVADESLAPELSGVSDAASCREWRSGLPLELARLGPADEDYWRQHRTAPKAFLTLAAARRLWASRHGSLTAIRFTDRTSGDAGALEAALAARLDPEGLGWRVVGLRDEGLRAAGGGLDFAALLLGLGAFLVIGSLVFVGLFQALFVARRQDEWRTLLAIGLSRARVERVILMEGLPVALLGTLAGGAAGGLFAGAVFRTLPGLREERSLSLAALSLTPDALFLGAALNVAVGLAVMVAASRRAAEGHGVGGASARTVARPRARTSLTCAVLGFAAAAAIRCWPVSDGRGEAAVVWASGALALFAGVAWTAGVLALLGRVPLRGARALGLRNLNRKRRRSLTLVAALGCGVFVMAAVSLGTGTSPGGSGRRSGTGGFAFVAEMALAVRHHPDDAAGRRALGLSQTLPARFVGLRVQEGDDASCRNLNRSITPRIVGVDPSELAARGAFSFAEVRPGLMPNRRGAPDAGEWGVLDRELGDGTIPAVADANAIAWGLRSRVGDVLDLRDGSGRPLRLRLVASLSPSVLAGAVIVSERHFTRLFPAAGGFGALLVDVEPRHAEAVASALRHALRDHGLDLVPAAARLSELRAVETAYAALFVALGGLGLLFGCAGCAAVVARDVTERSGELECLRALGFTPAQVEALLSTEHGAVFTFAACVGGVAALVSCAPGAAAASWIVVALLLAAVPVVGLVATRTASALLGRGETAVALRRD